MINTIICNNCTGGAVFHELGMEFKSPTINLQILPEEYPKFCQNIHHYMENELTADADMDGHRDMIIKMFGGVPDFPFGRLDDILVCFQHYPTFEDAKAKWNERRAKMDYDHIGYIFHARGIEYKKEAEAFLALDLPNKLCITQDFELPGSVRMDGEGFEAVNNKLRVVQAYDYRRWVNG